MQFTLKQTEVLNRVQKLQHIHITDVIAYSPPPPSTAPYLCTDVTAHIQQQLHSGGVAIHGCQHEGRYAQLAPSSAVCLEQ